MSGASSGTCNRQKVRAEPQQRRLGLDGAGRPQDQLPIRGIAPAWVELLEPSGQTFDPDQLHDLQVGAFELGPQLVGMVEEGGGEPVRPALWVAVLAFVEVPLHDRTEVRVEQELAGKAIEQRGEPGDRCGEDDAAGAEDLGRLPERTDPVIALGEVVERTEQQDGVEAGPSGAEVAGVTKLGGDAATGGRVTSGLLDVAGDGIDQVDVVAVGGQPGGVDPGAAAHIQDPLGIWWDVSTDDLAGAQQLELTQPVGDPLRLVDLAVVVLDDLVGEPFHGRQRTGPRRSVACRRSLKDSTAMNQRRMYFVVLRRLGPQWDSSRPMEEQSDWPAHASFMDGLVDTGFVILGGPLADEHRVVLVVEAESEDAVRSTLARDPWSETHLRIDTIDRWTIRLDGRGA